MPQFVSVCLTALQVFCRAGPARWAGAGEVALFKTLESTCHLAADLPESSSQLFGIFPPLREADAWASRGRVTLLTGCFRFSCF